MGRFWAGVLTSLPLLAAAVAIALHLGVGGPREAIRFLHGHASGLLGRGLFVAVFGGLAVPTGALPAFVAALALSSLVGWVTAGRLARRTARVGDMRKQEA